MGYEKLEGKKIILLIMISIFNAPVGQPKKAVSSVTRPM